MRRQTQYLMRDQVRDQIESIMEEQDRRIDRHSLVSHLFASGVLTFFYALLVVLGG